MELIENLKWRYATKKFDPNKKVSPQELEIIKEAVQLSASSYGLQPYKVVIIEDEALKQQLKSASWGQDKVVEASHLLIFCNYTLFKDSNVDDYIQLKAKTEGLELSETKGYGDFIKTKMAEKTEEEKRTWAEKQAYLALGNLLTACADLKVDACPMEGFEPALYNEILGLSGRGLNATVAAAIGYRAEDDHSQSAKKVRKPIEELFEVL